MTQLTRWAVAAAALSLAFAPAVLGATKTWTGAVDNKWSVSGNWSGGGVPVAGDDLVFPAGASHMSTENDIVGGSYVSMSFTGGSYTVNGNEIELSDGFTVSYPGNANVILPLRLTASQSFTYQFSGNLGSAVDLNGYDLGITGYNTTGSGIISGSGNVTLASVTITGNNTYTGTTTVNGAVSIRGVQPTSDVVVNGTLSGDGTELGTLVVTGQVTPGPGLPCCGGGNGNTGVITTKDLTLQGASAYRVDLQSSVPGTGHDQVVVMGTVSIAASATFNFALSGSAGFSVGDEVILISNDGVDAISGGFQSLPEGQLLTNGDYTFEASYTGGDGNDFSLTCTSAPSSWTGLVSNSWSVGGNWSGGVVPGAGAKLSFPGGSLSTSMNNDLPAGSFHSLRFTGGSYTVGGNEIDLSDGFVVSYPGNANVNFPIRLSASQSFLFQFSGNLGSPVDLNGHDLSITGYNTTASGIISGAGNVTFSSVTVTGDNTYTGLTTINGSVTIRGMQQASDVNVVGTLSGDGASLGAVTVSGQITPGPGLPCCGGGTGNFGTIATKNLSFQAGSALRADIQNISSGSGHDQVVVAGTVTIAPTATLSVNTSGATVFSVGDEIVLISNDGVDPISGEFSSHAEGFEFARGAYEFRISYAGGDGNDVTLVCTSAPGAWSGAVSNLWSVAGNWSGGVLPAAGTVLSFPGGAQNTSMSNDLVNASFDSLSFTGGSYTLQGNLIQLGQGFVVSYPANATVNLPIRLLGSQSFQFQFSGNVGSPVELNGHDLSITGYNTTASGVISGSGNVTLSSVTVTGNNTYTGSTTITGSVTLTGIQPSSDVTVQGTLSGNGAELGHVSASGRLSPGPGLPCCGGGENNTGRIVMKNLTLNGSSVLSVDIQGSSPGVGHDQLAVKGTVTIGSGATLTVRTSSSYTPRFNEQIVIIDNDGSDAVNGTFSEKPEGTILTSGGVEFRLTYVGGTGNDVALVSLSGGNPPPSIVSLSPGAGITDGGTIVTIVGANFVNGIVAFFGGTPSPGMTFVHSGEVRAVTPAGAQGAVDVVVVNPDGESGKLPGGFTYSECPAAAQVSGSQAICPGVAAKIRVDLVGAPPWRVAWSDGFVQESLTTTPVFRDVAPASTSTYRVVSVTDSECTGPGVGSARVEVKRAPSALISAPLAVERGTDANVASVPDEGSGATYSWTVANGAIVAGADSRQVIFAAASAGEELELSVVVNSSLSGCAAVSSIAIPFIGRRPASVVPTLLPEPIVVEAASGGGSSATLALTNTGEEETVVSVSSSDTFFDVAPRRFTLGGGGTQTVVVTAHPQPLPATLIGRCIVEGEGVPPGLSIPVRIIVAAPPGLGNPFVVAQTTRVDLAAEEGVNPSGTVEFLNTGSAPAEGLISTDASWIVPVDTEIVRIEPQQLATVSFVIDRSQRPDSQAPTGSVSGTLSFVYPAGASSARTTSNTPSLSTPVPITDTVRPKTTEAGIPLLKDGELSFTLPGVGNVIGSGGKFFVSDVSIVNLDPFSSVTDVKLYYLPPSGSASEASVSRIAGGQSVNLVNVVSTFFGLTQQVGTLHVRGDELSRLSISGSIFNDSDPRGRYGTVIPLLRNSYAAPPGEHLTLTGLVRDATSHTNLYIQEVSGAESRVTVEFLDRSGVTVAALPDLSIPAFGLTQLPASAPEGSVTAIVRNISGGSILGYATPVDNRSGDTWAIADWNRISDAHPSADRVIPVAGAVPGANATYFRTDVFVANTGPTAAGATLTYYSGGTPTTRFIQLEPLQTLVFEDVVTSLFNAVVPSIGFILFSQDGDGRFAVSSRTYTTIVGDEATYGTAVPSLFLSEALQRGDNRVIGGLEDTRVSTVRAATPKTQRTNFGLLETSGHAASVTVTALFADGRKLSAGGSNGSITLNLEPFEFRLVPSFLSAIIGEGRETSLGDLRNVQIRFQVTGGDGSVIPFVTSTDNGTGDTILRWE